MTAIVAMCDADHIASDRITEIIDRDSQLGARCVPFVACLDDTRYEGGVTSYLEVITAQNAALSDELAAVNILGRRMASAVLLIQAIGGGWDRGDLPKRPECCGKLAVGGD